MGMSISGYIGWGVQLGYGENFDEPCPWEDEDGEGEPLEWLAGLINPKGRPAEPAEGYDHESAAVVALYHAYWDRRREWIEDTLPGLDVEWSGHGDYEGCVLVVKSSVITTDWDQIGDVRVGTVAHAPRALLASIAEREDILTHGVVGWKFWAWVTH